MSSSNYFKSFITKFAYVPDLYINFDDKYTYYHDGIKNNGYFLKFNNILE